MTNQAPLLQQIIDLIEQNGPISLADYMGLALMHPTAGYYNRAHVFGAAGDFITAPEISQMFGEMIGLSLLDRWQQAGRPTPVRLIEFGPGRGTLMADMRRVMATDPDFAPTVHFIEASRARRSEQETLLLDVHHHEDLSSVPPGFTLMVANEFFDALPIRQFQFDAGQWRERLVGLRQDEQGPSLALGLGRPISLLPTSLLSHMAPPQQHDVVEIAEAGHIQAKMMADRLKSGGGVALIIDYGYDTAKFGSSFQAVQAHQMVDPFQDPGRADLTAHVCFAHLKTAFEGLYCHGPADQGPFLMALGIGERALQLSKAADPARQFDLLTALKRLTSPEEMGALFKVMMVTSKAQRPPGFYGA